MEDLAGRTEVDVYGAAVGHYRLALQRPQGTATVHASTPTVAEDGWSADGHTIVEVVTDDMSFLVDSVTMELTRQGRSVHLVVHPQLPVRRDITGALVEVPFDPLTPDKCGQEGTPAGASSGGSGSDGEEGPLGGIIPFAVPGLSGSDIPQLPGGGDSDGLPGLPSLGVPQ